MAGAKAGLCSIEDDQGLYAGASSEHHRNVQLRLTATCSSLQGHWEGRYARSDTWSRYPLRLFDRYTGAEVVPVVLDRPHGRPVDPRRVTYEVGPGLRPIPPPNSRRRRVQASARAPIEHSVTIMGDYWT